VQLALLCLTGRSLPKAKLGYPSSLELETNFFRGAKIFNSRQVKLFFECSSRGVRQIFIFLFQGLF